MECFFQPGGPGHLTSCNFVAPTGLANGPSSAATISPTQNFAISSVDLKPVGPGLATCSDDYLTSILINTPGVGQTQREFWLVAANSGTQHFAYPSGILIAGGTQFVGLTGIAGTTEACTMTVDIFGYLTTL